MKKTIRAMGRGGVGSQGRQQHCSLGWESGVGPGCEGFTARLLEASRALSMPPFILYTCHQVAGSCLDAHAKFENLAQHSSVCMHLLLFHQRATCSF